MKRIKKNKGTEREREEINHLYQFYDGNGICVM